ncbi:MAG: GNAT family N-acetyltransferase [Treponema sp.]|nr:GNAT family N-acetyltransferase [Treponema sp.]
MKDNYLEILYDNERLQTPRLVLRKFRREDAADFFEYGSDEETLRFLIWEGVKTQDEARAGIVEYFWAAPGRFALELKSEGKCIGSLDLRIDAKHEKAGFGYAMNRNYWGKGYMTEALTAVLELSFERLELNRVEATFYVGNEGSGRVMEKCGMEREGIGRQEVKVKGVFRDTVHCGITRERWLRINRPETCQ